jgi:hypothetical protein
MTGKGYTYQHARVTVTEIASPSGRSVIKLLVDWGTWRPTVDLRPASLLEIEHPHRKVIDLYEVANPGRSSLEYFIPDSGSAVPAVGGIFLLNVWWTSDALDAVESPDTEWQYSHWEDPEDHDHCWLCLRTIGPGAEDSIWEGYEAAALYRWLCPDCFRTYVEHGPPWARR